MILLYTQIGYDWFKASPSWVARWKRSNKVVSRKITKVLSSKQIRSLPDVSATISTFRNETRNKISKYLPQEISNTDQSGFNIELLSERTLAGKGGTIISASVQQSHSLTHSYTIQPLISMSGELIQPLFIVLQERSGEFGPNVSEDLFKHPEISIHCNTSGKVTKEMLKKWFQDIYFESFSSKSLLLLDSYSGHKDLTEVKKCLPRNKKFEIAQISPGITSSCQPLDVFFFRSYKSFVRRLSDHITHHRTDLKLHHRNTVLKLQAVTSFQFRSPRFRKFIQYAWFKTGLLENFNHDVRFEDPINFCFDQISNRNQCAGSNCQRMCLIQCSWCKKSLCFDHLFLKELKPEDKHHFTKMHYCSMYIP